MISNDNTQKQVKLKAGIEEIVGPLFNRISVAKGPKEEIVKNMCILIKETEDFIKSRQKWDNELMRVFGNIERQIEYCQGNKGTHNERTCSTEEEEKCERMWTVLMENFKELLEKWRLNPSIVNTIAQQEGSSFSQETTKYEVGGPSNMDNQVDDAKNKVREYTNEFGLQQNLWLKSLDIFPLYSKLKKRLLVHWWISLKPSEGKVNTTAAAATTTTTKQEDNTEEQLAEKFFDDLVKKGILEPIHRKHSQVINQCTINPTLHKHFGGTVWPIQGEDGYWHFVSDSQNKDSKCAQALLNVDQKYLNSNNIASKDVLGDKNTLKVVHFGRWHCTDLEIHNKAEKVVSFETKSQDHIEVDGTDFLNELGENVIFLSLRGISMIDELPESIGKLKFLRILDLRACHNLIKLPYKPQAKTLWLKSRQESWFNNLTHLDISECYLLNHIPKWVCQLSNLEVFKGYLAGTEDKSDVCQPRDLKKLKKLRKLSIRIVKPLNLEDVNALESLSWLSILTVSWSTNELNNDDDLGYIAFPKNLEKLDIRSYPEADASTVMNPASLPELKRLYIRGGKIAKIVNESDWTVEILRLRFLNSFEIRWCKLNHIFSKLKHVEYELCPKLKDFPDDRSAWNKEKDGSFPGQEIITADPMVVKVKIRRNFRVPLARNKQKIMLELTGPDFMADRPRLTLVAVLDVRESMEVDNRIEKLKFAMLFVINKLSSDDRLSIVTLSNEARTLWPLQQITESSRRELQNLVKSLTTSRSSSTNIIDGLRMGLHIFNDLEISTQDSTGIILMSCGETNDIKQIYRVRIYNVPVHIFALGGYVTTKDLGCIANTYKGATYSDVSNSENLIKAVSVCLAGLLTVAVQDLTLTLTPSKESSTIVSICAGDYYQHEDNDGQVTIKFGNLYSGEVRKVLVELDLFDVNKPGDTEVLKVSHSYKSLSGTPFVASPDVIIVPRKKIVSLHQQGPLPAILAEESRLETAEKIREIMPLLDKYRGENVDFFQRILELIKEKLHGTKESLGLLSAEIAELYEITVAPGSSEKLIRNFVVSFLISHERQRAAARGVDIEKCLSFATPTMLSFLSEAEKFCASPYSSSDEEA